MTSLERMKRSIGLYLEREFGNHDRFDFDDLEHIAIGYTTTSDDEELPIQLYADLVHPQVWYTVDERTVYREIYHDLDEMLEAYGGEGDGFEFDRMVGEAEWAWYEMKGGEER